MFSHQHPEGHVSQFFVFTCTFTYSCLLLQAHFNVYSNPEAVGKWGKFTNDSEVPWALGPEYGLDDPEDRARYSDSKVSDYNGPQKAVLLARLRFKTDSTECTSR